jgi:hypothetical protein
MKRAECLNIPPRKQRFDLSWAAKGHLPLKLDARGMFRNEDMRCERERGFRIQGMF